MDKQTEFTPAELFRLARKHYLIGIFCLVLCLFLEIWFFNYPPRGVIAEDVIITGSIIGSPLVNFQSVWTRFFNDDELMLQIIDRAKICNYTDRIERLNFLNRSIRKNLRYQQDNETVIKISLKRPGFNDVRPFLNHVTDTLVEKLNAIGHESFELRKEKAMVQHSRVIERIRFIADIFAIQALGEIIGDPKSTPPPTTSFLNALQSDDIKSGLAQALLSELLSQYSSAQINYEPYFNDSMKILELFPRSSIVLSARDMPATPVQPFYELIFILVPLALTLVYVSLLVFFARNHARPGNV